jgi:ComEC/Rec2-related protein
MKQRLNKLWWKEKIHVSWFIAWVSVAILEGIAVAPKVGNIFFDITWLIIALSLLSVVLIKRARYMVGMAIIVGLLLGLWRGSAAHAALTAYKPYIGKHLTVSGHVSEDTSYGPKGDLRMRLNDVHIQNRTLVGTIWISTAESIDIKRGDYITVTGMLAEGFGNIPASMYRASIEKIERPNPGDVGRRVRDWFGHGVNRAMPADDANFAMALLVGQKLTISDTLNDQLRTVGLIHAVVASGTQLTILVGIARRLFRKISKYLATLMSGSMMIGFILITGFSPSMSRAGLVSGLSLAAWYYGRVIHPLVLLPFAAAITAIFNPAYVWGDVGWYLSFASFGGVIILAPLINAYFWGNKRPGILREILIMTFAAQIVTLPLIIHIFGYFSIYALLANLLVVPLIPLTMLLTFIAGVVGLAVPVLADWFGLPVSVVLQYMITVVNWTAHLPNAKTELSFGLPLVAASYAVLTIVAVLLWKATDFNFRQDNSEKLL